MRIRNIHRYSCLTAPGWTTGTGFCNSITFSINKFQSCRPGIALEFKFHIEYSVLILRVQIGNSTKVFNTSFCTGIKVTVSGNPAETEEILILEIGAVTPAEHLHCDKILLSGLYILCDIELGLKLAVFAVTYE